MYILSHTILSVEVESIVFTSTRDFRNSWLKILMENFRIKIRKNFQAEAARFSFRIELHSQQNSVGSLSYSRISKLSNRSVIRITRRIALIKYSTAYCFESTKRSFCKSIVRSAGTTTARRFRQRSVNVRRHRVYLLQIFLYLYFLLLFFFIFLLLDLFRQSLNITAHGSIKINHTKCRVCRIFVSVCMYSRVLLYLHEDGRLLETVYRDLHCYRFPLVSRIYIAFECLSLNYQR